MDHSEALASLLAFAERPSTLTPELEQALSHMTTCPTCATGERQLSAALKLGVEDRLSCAESEGLLPEYLAAPDLGRDEAPAWSDLRAHLVGCPACLAALADLALLRDLAEGAGIEPPSYPPPRRVAPAHATRAWRTDELGRLLVDLAQALSPAMRLAPLAGVKRAPGQPALVETIITDALPDLELHIAVESRPGRDLSNLIVTVTIPSRGGWPNMSGIEVAILRSGEEVNRITTDAFGTAAFLGLAADDIPRLSLRVRPGAAT